MKLELNFFVGIAEYFYLFNEEEAMKLEDFVEIYGNAMGNHYYSKWTNYCKRDIIKMATYFRKDSADGKLFFDLLSKKITMFETRKNNI